MDLSSFATKGNLIRAKANLALAKMGYDLMDKKRSILITEMLTYISRAEDIQTRIDETFSNAYQELQNANVSLGINSVERIGFAIPEVTNLRIRFKGVMGVEIPLVTVPPDEGNPFRYAFSNTNYSLDQAYIHFNRVKNLIIEMAEVENSIYRLSVNVKKAQKRANALESLMIPRLTELVANITNTLDEKEREESSRLHVIKNLRQKASSR